MSHRYRFSIRIFIATMLLAVLGVWVSSCTKNNTVTNPGSGNSGTSSGTAKVSGVVKDAEDNSVIAGATVKISGDSVSTTTDINGVFTISVPAGVSKTIDVSKTGYSLNEVVVKLDSGTTKNVSVSLLQAGSTQSISVNSGGTVQDQKSNASISLPANFVTASGSVNVTVTGLDPTTDQIKALPGGLTAVDANGNTKYLQPVSFAEYTVRDANGNVLQFNSSASSGANIELPIPASLRGKPGYKNGDPIECYLFDASDGKWKTPVPGVIGPSSADASIPAIKATIFHLSWYGGAPAVNQQGCVQGYVKNNNGTPATGVDVEAFPGSTTTTDQNGFYHVNVASSSNVRIVATSLSGSTVSTGEIVVYASSSVDSCNNAPDLTLGQPQQGSFEVDATLYKSPSGGETFDFALANIKLKTANGNTVSWDSADVKIGYGNQFVTLTSEGSGSYYVYTGMPGAENFSLTPGVQYEIKIDFDKNGTVDANGSVRMVGITTITNPTDSGTVGSTFTATWFDSGAVNPGYSANYWLLLSGDSTAAFFLTTSTSKVIGDGSIDSTFFGYPQANNPLPAGKYQMSIWSFNGPSDWLSSVGAQLPNINGQNVEGYFYCYYFGNPVSFTSTGAGAKIVANSASKLSRSKVPFALKKFFKAVPSLVKKKSGITLSLSK